MGSLNFIFSLFGWTFIPDFATRHLLDFLYHKSPIRIFAPTQPGSPQHRKHYAITFAFVIFSYLGYTLYESASAMPPNFYQILGVAPDVDESGLKLAFRSFAKRYHPDRPGVGQAGMELFMYVRDAYEALKDPVVRFAYDRFGADVLKWRRNCKTTREFMQQGLMVSSGYHIVAGIALLFWSAIGSPSSVSFWRYVLFGALFAAELSFILSPFPSSPSDITPPTASFLSFLSSSSPSSSLSIATFRTPSFLQTIFPNRVPYQHILFLHQIFMVLSVALSRVVPRIIFLLGDGASDTRKLNPLERDIWERVYGTIAIADREASIILHTILHSITPASKSPEKPYHHPTLANMSPLSPAQTKKAFDQLTPEMRNLIIEANIKNQTAGPIANTWNAVLRKAASAAASKSTTTTEAGAEAKTPSTPRSTNFWEKATGVVEDTEASMVFVDTTMAASAVAGTAESPLKRVPSTPRLGRRDLSSSPTKPRSPVRKGSLAGEM
ncbi:hypothetical protein BDN70DRAFT_79649 [Pholiota conissans]|uniref:J domain-containing protein n=1 Tax=Pholiota conissans TaxID=109636 RepID=A0A9P5Z063_9AGAR|nr:hypothetical protein BDN70DRAFT_79649 [Pholiota conissans]